MMQRVLFLLLFTCAVAVRADQPSQPLPEIALQLNGQALIVEVASSDAQREQGLMYRRILPTNHGMLFVFAQPTQFGMWMKNTVLPLSVAFLDENGVVINIANMKPQTTDVHATARPAKFAIEANLGWFKQHHIKAGIQVHGLEQAPPAQ